MTRSGTIDVRSTISTDEHTVKLDVTHNRRVASESYFFAGRSKRTQEAISFTVETLLKGLRILDLRLVRWKGANDQECENTDFSSQDKK